MPLDELQERLNRFERCMADAEQQRVVAADILAGDKRRAQPRDWRKRLKDFASGRGSICRESFRTTVRRRPRRRRRLPPRNCPPPARFRPLPTGDGPDLQPLYDTHGRRVPATAAAPRSRSSGSAGRRLRCLTFPAVKMSLSTCSSRPSNPTGSRIPGTRSWVPFPRSSFDRFLPPLASAGPGCGNA